jgi:hypothetical protein
VRYRLRTLLLLLSLAPPVFAGIAWLTGFGEAGQLALFVAIYIGLAALLIVASKFLELTVPYRPRGMCSYCGLAKRPLVEGPEDVLICRECAERCIALIDEETARQNQAERRSPGQAHV